MSIRQTGVLHHPDGTTEPVVFERMDGPFLDYRAMTEAGEPLKLHRGDHVTIDKRMPGQSFLLADKISGRAPYISAQSARDAQSAKRLPAPRVRLAELPTVAR